MHALSTDAVHTTCIMVAVGLLAAEGGDRPVYAMQWAATEGVVPLDTYPYIARTDDCLGSFDGRTVEFAGAQVVDLSKPDNILQVIGHG